MLISPRDNDFRRKDNEPPAKNTKWRPTGMFYSAFWQAYSYAANGNWEVDVPGKSLGNVCEISFWISPEASGWLA